MTRSSTTREYREALLHVPRTPPCAKGLTVNGRLPIPGHAPPRVLGASSRRLRASERAPPLSTPSDADDPINACPMLREDPSSESPSRLVVLLSRSFGNCDGPASPWSPDKRLKFESVSYRSICFSSFQVSPCINRTVRRAALF